MRPWDDDSDDDEDGLSPQWSIQNLDQAPPPPPSSSSRRPASFDASHKFLQTLRRISEVESNASWHRRRSSSGGDSHQQSHFHEGRTTSHRQHHRRWRSGTYSSSSSRLSEPSSNTTTGSRRRIFSDGDDRLRLSRTAAAGGASNRSRVWSAENADPSSPNSSSRDVVSIKSFPPDGEVVSTTTASRRGEFQNTAAEKGMLELPEDSALDIHVVPDELFGENIIDGNEESRYDSSFGASMSFTDSRQNIGEVEQNRASVYERDAPKGIRKLLRDCWERDKWTRPVAVFVSTKAPCFLCCKMQYATDRNVLTRLNIIGAFFATVQLACAIGFFVVLLDPRIVNRNSTSTNPNFDVIYNLWSVNGFLLLLAGTSLVIIVSAMSTVRVIRNVDLVNSIRYLWVLMWIIPIEVSAKLRRIDCCKCHCCDDRSLLVLLKHSAPPFTTTALLRYRLV